MVSAGIPRLVDDQATQNLNGIFHGIITVYPCGYHQRHRLCPFRSMWTDGRVSTAPEQNHTTLIVDARALNLLECVSSSIRS